MRTLEKLLGEPHADPAVWRGTFTEENNTAFFVDPLYGFDGHRRGDDDVAQVQ